jgi:hypothetical protein
MNTDPTPVIDPGERDELDAIFHHPGNETGANPTSDMPEVLDPVDPEPPLPEDPAGPEQPGPEPPVQPEVPRPDPPRHPDIPRPVDPEPPRPVDPERPRQFERPVIPVHPEPPRDPGPPRHPEPPRGPESPRGPDQPGPPRQPEQPKPPVRLDQPGPPRQPEHPGPPRDPEVPRQPDGPRQLDGPRPPVQPEDLGPPVQPEEPRPPQGPDHPGPPCVPVDCLPAGCVISETAFLAGLAGAMAAFTACLAVVGLYVVVRYIGQYIFYAALSLLILAIVYLHLRRPEDARRLRRFLAGRGREALGRLWGWATQRAEVYTIFFFTRPAIKIPLKSRDYV